MVLKRHQIISIMARIVVRAFRFFDLYVRLLWCDRVPLFATLLFWGVLAIAVAAVAPAREETRLRASVHFVAGCVSF